MQHFVPVHLSLGRSCSTNPRAVNGDFCKAWSHGGQYVKIASGFELAAVIAWWERSLELQLLSTHFMQDTARSEAQRQLRRSSVLLPVPVSHPDLGFSCKSHCLSSCFCFFLCVVSLWPFLLFYLGYCPLNPSFFCSSISFCLRAGFLPALWVSRSVHGLCAHVEHGCNADIFCQHQHAILNAQKLLLLLSHDIPAVNKVF